MNNFELINYTPIADNEYLGGLATVRMQYFDGSQKPQNIDFVYGYNKYKNGGGKWGPANWYKADPQNLEKKKAVPSIRIDSSSKNEQLLEFIEQSVARYQSIQTQMQASVNAYNQQTLPNMPAPSTESGGPADDGTLPF